MITFNELNKRYEDITQEDLEWVIFSLTKEWEREYHQITLNYLEDENFPTYRKRVEENEIRQELEFLDRKYRFITDKHNYKTEIDYSTDYKFIQRNTFARQCYDNLLTDTNGLGYYATQDKRITDICVYPSDVKLGMLRNDYPYICWKTLY